MRTVQCMPKTKSTNRTPSAPIYLTVDEACDQLACGRATLYRWWERGVGPRRVKLPNGSLRIQQAWLDDYFMGFEVGA